MFAMFQKLFAKKKKVKIEFCQRNLQEFLSEEDYAAYQDFLAQKNVAVQEYECQSRCKECRMSPYAVINGEMIAAESSAELLEKMKEHT
jgi:uncharacterized protein YuzB (UPF0349 family)